jgi:hypothetical protein
VEGVRRITSKPKPILFRTGQGVAIEIAQDNVPPMIKENVEKGKCGWVVNYSDDQKGKVMVN